MASQKNKKDFILTYRSREHYEVLGWLRATSLAEAKKQAQKEFLKDINFYGVKEAQIAEWQGQGTVFFKVNFK